LSANQLIWLIYGALAAVIPIGIVAQWLCGKLETWRNRLRRPRLVAELDRLAARSAALSALTTADRSWLQARGWKP